MIEEAGQVGQFSPNGGTVPPSSSWSPSGQHVCVGQRPKLISGRESHKAAGVFQVVLIGAPSARVVEIGEPFHNRSQPALPGVTSRLITPASR